MGLRCRVLGSRLRIWVGFRVWARGEGELLAGPGRLSKSAVAF